MHSNALFGLFRDPILPSAQCTWSNPPVHLAPASVQESHHTIRQSLQRGKNKKNLPLWKKNNQDFLWWLKLLIMFLKPRQNTRNVICFYIFLFVVTFQNTTRFWKNNTNRFHTGNHYCFWCSASSIAWWWLTQEDTGWLTGKGWHHEISRSIRSTYLSGRSVGSWISPTNMKDTNGKMPNKQAEAMNIHESWTFMWAAMSPEHEEDIENIEPSSTPPIAMVQWKGPWNYPGQLSSWRYLLPSPFTGRVHWILTMDLPFPQRVP